VPLALCSFSLSILDISGLYAAQKSQKRKHIVWELEKVDLT